MGEMHPCPADAALQPALDRVMHGYTHVFVNDLFMYVDYLFVKGSCLSRSQSMCVEIPVEMHCFQLRVHAEHVERVVVQHAGMRGMCTHMYSSLRAQGCARAVSAQGTHARVTSEVLGLQRFLPQSPFCGRAHHGRVPDHPC